MIAVQKSTLGPVLQKTLQKPTFIRVHIAYIFFFLNLYKHLYLVYKYSSVLIIIIYVYI